MKVNPIDKFLWFSFCCWILIDSINGLMRVIGMDIPFSQIVKFGVLVVAIIRMIKKDSIKLLLVFFLLYIVIVLSNVYILCNDVYAAAVLMLKPISTFFFFLYFRYFQNKNHLYFYKLSSKVILFNFIFIAANIILGLMGYGNHVYTVGEEESVGVKGFIISQNEMSLAVAVIFPLFLLLCSHKYKRLIYYLICMMIITISVCISTKASIIVSLVSVFFVSYNTGRKRERKIILISAVAIIVLAVTYFSIILSSDIGFIQRFSFFLENKGFQDAIFSGRLDQLEIESNVFFNKREVLTQIFGQGEVSCELDPYQALFSFGYIGGFLNSLLLLYLVFVSRKIGYKDAYGRTVVISNYLIVLISILSGHVFFSSMGGLFLSLSNASIHGRKS